MIYHLLYPLHDVISLFNVFRYITFRTIYATITAMLIAFVLGPWLIRKLQSLQIGQPIRELGPDSHFVKQGTPTMGGVLILFSVVISTLLWANLTTEYIWYVLMATVGFGLIGFIDDYQKLAGGSSKGVPARLRLAAEIAIALFISVFMFIKPGFNSRISLPFFKTVLPDLGWGYVVLSTFIIVGRPTRSTSLTGLTAWPSARRRSVSSLICCSPISPAISGLPDTSRYLTYRGAGELAVFCGAMVGAGIGFLWYNSYPAQIFMGDVGSLSLGGALGTLAVVDQAGDPARHSRAEFLCWRPFSVIFQVGWFKVSNGKRIFRMAPIHHHFELKGWAEPKVIVRFWIVSIILALLAISTLKLR